MSLKIDQFLLCPKCSTRIPKRYFEPVPVKAMDERYNCPVCNQESFAKELKSSGLIRQYKDFGTYIFKALSEEEGEYIRDFLIETYGIGEGVCRMTGTDYDEDTDIESEKVIATVSVVELDPIWCIQQPWYDKICQSFGKEDVDPPKYVIRLGFSGNTGCNILLREDYTFWDEMEILNGNAPGFQGSYVKEDREAILQWIKDLINDILEKEYNSLWI